MNKQNQGFTLVEILIAIAIMAFLTVFTAQSIQSSLRSSTKYRRQIDESAELRDVLKIMEKDINLAFHYRNVHQEINDELDKENKKKETSNSFRGNSEEEDKNHTAFKGEANSLHFTSLNNVRLSTNIKESDQAEIGYFLRTCQSRGNSKNTSNCLWRRISPFIDKDVDEGGRAIVLIENIKSLNFKYMGEVEDDAEPEWKDRWLSDEGTDESTKDKFPEAVQINIAVNRKIGEKTVEQSMSTVAAIRFPNNKKEKPKEENETNNQQN